MTSSSDCGEGRNSISERTLRRMDRAVVRVEEGTVGEEFDLAGLDVGEAGGE